MTSTTHAIRISILLLGLAALGILSIAQQPQMILKEARLSSLPMRIGSLTGRDLFWEDSVYAALNADANVIRHYAGPGGQVISLYIGYYGTAKGGRASHMPQFCYTGQGWDIEAWDRTSVALGGTADRFPVNRMIVKRGTERELVYFWHQAEDAVMITGWALNWHKVRQRLLFQRNDGAFVRVSARVRGAVNQTEPAVRDFSAEIRNLLPQFWPVEEPAKQARILAFNFLAR
jgi:EpsI family protein